MVGPVPSPDPARVYEAALVAISRHDWVLADALYLQLANLLPGNHKILVNRAQVCWYSDRPELARRLYSEAQEITRIQGCPDPLPLQGLGNALRDLNRFEEADEV